MHLLQGLNYVAALLLLVMKTEEDAFWMRAVLLENVLVSDCYTDTLSGCHVEQRVFKDLLAKKCPRFFFPFMLMTFRAETIMPWWLTILYWSIGVGLLLILKQWGLMFHLLLQNGSCASFQRACLQRLDKSLNSIDVYVVPI